MAPTLLYMVEYYGSFSGFSLQNFLSELPDFGNLQIL